MIAFTEKEIGYLQDQGWSVDPDAYGPNAR